MKRRFLWKLQATYLLVILLCLGLVGAFLSFQIESYYARKITVPIKGLSEELHALARSLAGMGARLADRSAMDPLIREIGRKLAARVELLSREGVVISDSEEGAERGQSYAYRPEVQDALKTDFGRSLRFGTHLGTNMLYIAVPLVDSGQLHGIIRLSFPLTEAEASLQGVRKKLYLGVVAVLLIAFFIGLWFSRSITGPILMMTEFSQRMAQGELGRRITVKSRDEVGVLAENMNYMAQELEKRIEGMKRLERMRVDFVANVSHELRTPLTTIKGFVEALQDGAMGDKAAAERFLKIISSETNRLTRLLDDLLTLSNIELGKVKLEFDLVPLLGVTDNILRLFQPRATEKGIALRVEMAEELPLLWADRDRLAQILINLVDNALKFTLAGGTVTLKATSLPGSGGDPIEGEAVQRVEVTVEDTGIGIPAEDLSRVTEPFYRVDKARSREMGGTGLGLAIVKHLVAAHGGEMKVESQPGRGTEVRFSIPAA